jgi:hypothetical protein
MYLKVKHNYPKEIAVKVRDLLDKYKGVFRINIGREPLAKVTPYSLYDKIPHDCKPVANKTRPLTEAKRSYLRAYYKAGVSLGHYRFLPDGQWG